MFLKVSQNSTENTCARGWGLQLYQKRDSGTGVSLWIAKLLRTASVEHSSGYTCNSDLLHPDGLFHPIDAHSCRGHPAEWGDVVPGLASGLLQIVFIILWFAYSLDPLTEFCQIGFNFVFKVIFSYTDECKNMAYFCSILTISKGASTFPVRFNSRSWTMMYKVVFRTLSNIYDGAFLFWPLAIFRKRLDCRCLIGSSIHLVGWSTI